MSIVVHKIKVILVQNNIALHWHSLYSSAVNALKQINFNCTNFINTRLTQRVFSVWPVAHPVVGSL